MEREKKIELVQRALGLKHKLKVHESMKASETHEEMAHMAVSRWELEDELKAIDEVIDQVRHERVLEKKQEILKILSSPGQSLIKDKSMKSE